MTRKSEFDKMVDLALAEGCVFTPEVAAEVDRLLSREAESAPPLTPAQRQRFIAAAQRGLAGRREELNRVRLSRPCRCCHRFVDHGHKGCVTLVEWQPGSTTECPCRRFVDHPDPSEVTR